MTPPWSRVHRLRRRAAELRVDAILNELSRARNPLQSPLNRWIVWAFVATARDSAARLDAEAAAIEGTWRRWLP